MRHLLLTLTVLVLTGAALGQGGNTVILRYAGAPTGSCSVVAVAVNNATGEYFDCLSGAWHSVGGTGGSGTVTSVSFTGGLISVANPTTTPAFTVAGTSGGVPYFSGAATWASSGALTANGVVLGGGAGNPPTVTSADSTTTHGLFATAGAPAFRALASADLPTANTAPGTGITFGAAAINQGTSAVSYTTALALAISVGQTVVVGINMGSNVNYPFIADDGGNSYSYVLTSNSSAGLTEIFVCVNARNAAAHILATMTSSAGSGSLVGTTYSMAAATYNGVKSIGAVNNGSNSGTTAGTISLTTTVANSYMVSAMAYFSNGNVRTVVANTGSLRTSNSSSSGTTTTGLAIVDNTSASIGSETTALTANGTANWANVSIELIPN